MRAMRLSRTRRSREMPTVVISVADARNGHEIRFPVGASRAMDAFHHPFAYAP